MIGFNSAHESVQRGKRTIRPLLWYLLFIPVFILADIVVAQSQTDIERQFMDAVELFHLNEREEAISILDDLSETICSNQIWVEYCVKSKIFQSNHNRRERQLIKAEEYIEEGFEIASYSLDEEHPLFIKFYYEMALLESELGDMVRAREYTVKAVEFVEKLAITELPRSWAYLSVGIIESELGNYRESVTAYKEVINALQGLEKDLEVIRLLTQVHNNIGIVYRRLGELTEAMDHYLTNLELVKEAFGDEHFELALSYNSIGTIYYSTGDYGTAGDYFLRSAEIFITNLGENHPNTAAAFNNSGLSYFRMGDLDRASETLERAQRIKETVLGEEHPETAYGYANLASIYLENEEYEAAKKNYERSIDVRLKAYGQSHPSLADSYHQLGALYIKMDEFALARENLRKAESIVKERIGERHPEIARINLNKGNTYAKEENLELANQHYITSFNQIAGTNAFNERNFNIDDITYPIEFIKVTKAFGDVRLKEFKKNNNEKHLHETLEFYEMATEMIDLLQTRYQSEASKLNLVDSNYSIYTNIIEALYELHKKTSENLWLDKALQFTEMSRAKIALELLQQIEARNFGGVSQEILEQERELNSRISHYHRELHLEQEKGFNSDEEIVSSYRDSLFYERRDLEQFTETLENDYPAYFALKYETELADRDQIVRLLNRDEVFISYIIGEEFVYAIVVGSEEYGLHQLYKSEGLANEVEKLRISVVTGDTDQYKITARSLYLKLLEPLESITKGKSLVIAPDQMLHYLPFEMLLTESAGNKPYHQLPYLVRDRDVTYAPSATVLNSMNNRKPDSPRNLFALAPFHQSKVEVSADGTHQRYLADLSPLPLTLYETQEISKLFGNRRSLWDFFTPERTEVYIDDSATKETLLSGSLLDFGYIHLATHAFVNESNPSLSGIALRGKDGLSEIAYVSDIYNLQMNADLVVLSACETGLGRMYKGEGLIGFTRSFIYAGASNLVVSMWKVNDQPTANLMIEFYRHIRNGDSYSTSLRKAKLSLIDHPEYAAPRNWAAFVLQGR